MSKAPFPFFKFKNKETEEKIMDVLSMYEGVLPDQMNRYLCVLHSRAKAALFIETKNLITEFWLKHNHLSLSDVKGLFDMSLMDIQLQRTQKGDAVIDMLKRLPK